MLRPGGLCCFKRLLSTTAPAGFGAGFGAAMAQQLRYNEVVCSGAAGWGMRGNRIAMLCGGVEKQIYEFAGEVGSVWITHKLYVVKDI